MKLKLSAPDDTEVKDSGRINKLTVCLVRETTSSSRVSDEQARLVTMMNSIGTDVDYLIARKNVTIRSSLEELAPLFNESHHAAFEELANPLVAEFTTFLTGPPASVDWQTLPTVRFTLTKRTTLKDINVVPSGSVPSPWEVGGVTSFEKAVMDDIGDLIPSKPSASHAAKVFHLTGAATIIWWGGGGG